ncbi:VWA domain-containing protein [Massilia sp. CCM 8733]|uniref:VWA domain-containing protein n=1 Tax=Massilia mucilaginosa TaxID=2609282 RepID=A0ABX0NZ94_9BURK|nr:VWA domain-containing protein [Massilia mucilaginosa]NHZ91905.1 VWA domain-containing protein [Massilia mucilaginosa]
MSHITGTIQVLGAPLVVGPGLTVFNPPASPQPGGTKLLMLHFQNLAFAPGDRLQVNLGYDVDTFTAADGPAFWTRPINVYAFPAGVQITYIAAGAPTGSVQLDQYGRGERHIGEAPVHISFSNSDPFYQGPSYEEPDYDPFWYCSEPPNWENASCATPPADVRARVARSAGMIVSVHGAHLSTCSVTLVDGDKIITAGHCHTPAEALSSSVTFDYRTECGGARPPGYNPRFYKVKAVLAHRWDGSDDYSLLQLAEAPPGVPSLQMRHDLPLPSEQVFGVHHPNGAVKKLSLPHAQGFAGVEGSGAFAITVPTTFDVTGGSSGSGLFDLAGRITGVLSKGDPCHGGRLGYFPSATILQRIVPTPPPPITRDVMLVFDRSGSMALDDGSGRAKIESARDALSLFVQLVRSGTGNRLGLVSFSSAASAPVDFALAPVTDAAKNALVGPPPYIGGRLPTLTPGGNTSIGAGLDAARAQLAAAPGANPRAILLMTDGLQNTAPSIASIEPALAGITVHAIGFGAESSLDGTLLSAVATAHDGLYTRAGGALALEKFYATAFGNIFETGILLDPEFDLGAAQQAGTPVPFRVCGEDAITAIAGWDNSGATLQVEVTTPSGAVLTAAVPGVAGESGRTWAFLRIALPIGGERDGLWHINVVRPRAIPIPLARQGWPALRYFVNVIPSGGARMSRTREPVWQYTGDEINPMVLVRHEDGGWPRNMQARLTVTRPDTGVGNLLSETGLGAPGNVGGDLIPPRHATLQALEKARGRPVVGYVQTELALSGDSFNTRGSFEETATVGRRLADFLTVEGNYTFHARATYGDECTGMRELTWSVHVEIGIDGGQTDATITDLPPRPDGGACYRMRFTPRDKYGNRLGPGRADGFSVEAQPGSTPMGAVLDAGDGSYQVDVCTEPGSLEPPRIGLAQPGRPAAVVAPAGFTLYAYSVKFLCGEQEDGCCECAPVRPGRYSTEINIHNGYDKPAPLLKRVIPLVLAGAVLGREPHFAPATTLETLLLPAHNATMDDCCRLATLLLGAAPAGPLPLTVGILEIISTVELSVTAVYTAGDVRHAPSIDVQQITSRVLKL